MSDYLLTAVLTSNVTADSANTILGTWIDQLLGGYELGFRGVGGVMRLRDNGPKFPFEDDLPANDPGRVVSATDLTRDVLEGLARRYRWLSITASIGIPDVDHALDIKVAIVPSGDAEHPVAAVAHLDARLYHAVEPDDTFDARAMERFRDLIVMLGAHPLVEGFHAANVETFGELMPFTGAALQASLRSPTPVGVARHGGHFVHGIVTGIKGTLMSLDQLRPTWGDGELFETATGFSVLNCMVEIDESLFDDDDEPTTVG
jgi:hypothetical protein